MAMTQGAPVGTRSATGSRPRSVNSALLILGLVIVLTVAGPLLPSSEGEVVFGVVAGLIGMIAAAGLFALRRWGYIMTLVVAALTVLLDAPAVFVASTAFLKATAAVIVLACVLILVFVTRQEARDAYR
jgi:uncharacterized membrane protein (DUF2068 family)